MKKTKLSSLSKLRKTDQEGLERFMPISTPSSTEFPVKKSITWMLQWNQEMINHLYDRIRSTQTDIQFFGELKARHMFGDTNLRRIINDIIETNRNVARSALEQIAQRKTAVIKIREMLDEEKTDVC